VDIQNFSNTVPDVITPQKRIVILTADAGFGHRSAANAISAALAEMHPSGCQVFILNPHDDPRVPGFLRDGQASYDKVVRENRELHKFNYVASDNPVTGPLYDGLLSILLFDALKDILTLYRPDAVITTYLQYHPALESLYRRMEDPPPLITVVTDLTDVHRMWFCDTSTLCLVPTIEVHNQAIMNGLDPQKVIITGIPVNPNLAKPVVDKCTAREAIGLQPDRFTPLIVGSKRVRGLGEVIDAINLSSLPVQPVIITGGDAELYEQLSRAEWKKSVALYDYIPDIAPLLQIADCVISKAGGLIVSEALACGLPLLLIDVLPGQEVGNLQYVLAGEAGEAVAGPEEAIRLLARWADRGNGEFRKCQENAIRLGRPDSAYRAAHLAWEAAARQIQRSA